jgi:2-iminobutanoate/2-iminopropanoate deaminase
VPRRSIDIAGFRHANPIPAACRIGPLVVSGVIAPRNPGTDDIPDDVEDQVANLFHHVGEMLTAAGGDWRHVAKMSFFVPDLALRAAINKSWLEHFPDAEDRPARHIQASPAGGSTVSCEFMAYIDD